MCLNKIQHLILNFEKQKNCLEIGEQVKLDLTLSSNLRKISLISKFGLIFSLNLMKSSSFSEFADSGERVNANLEKKKNILKF